MSTPPAGISEADWLATPSAVRSLILAQQQEIEQLRGQLTALASELASLRECEFLVSYNFGSYVTSSSDRVSYRALKYLGMPSYSYSTKHFTAAFRRLEEISVTLGDTLIRDLASDMSSTIESSDSSISFISCSDDTPERRDWPVVFAQTFVFTQDEDAEEKAADLGYNKAGGKRLFDWLLEDYRWQVSMVPIPGWRNRLKSLRAEASPWRALKKYCDFMEQTNDIRLTLYEVESEIDSYIELQSDILRGK